MVQFSKNFRKNIAFDLRKKGFSYSEIKVSVPVAKSTLSYWFKDLKLTENQTRKLKEKQAKISRQNIMRKNEATAQNISYIKANSVNDIKEISKRELWLMGIMLYWRQGFLNDTRKGVSFTSSESKFIKLFLKWLKEAGRIKESEIICDIFIDRSKKQEIPSVINYWANITNFTKESFPHIYFQKTRLKRTKKKSSKKAHYGLLRLRVRSSTMLARQINGWIEGIQQRL